MGYGPHELVLIDSAAGAVWVPRARPMPSHQSAEDECIESQETTTVSDPLDRANLTPKQRFVIELRHGIRGGRPLTFQEIADLMGIKRQNVHRLWVRARKKTERVLFEEKG